MAVVRCVCYQRTFKSLKQEAASKDWKRVSDITTATGCGSGCGGCVPYLQAMMRTGDTCFSVREMGQTPKPCEPDPWDDID